MPLRGSRVVVALIAAAILAAIEGSVSAMRKHAQYIVIRYNCQAFAEIFIVTRYNV